MSYVEQDGYPRLKKLMAGYINMDSFEITGSHDIKVILEYYCTRVSPKSKKELLVEIDNFQSEYENDLHKKFEFFFDYGYDIKSTKDFFSMIREVVEHDINKVKKTWNRL